MISTKTKIILTIILSIISISLITFFELVNFEVIKIDFKFFDTDKYKKINGESMLYILEMSGILLLFTGFSLILVPIYIWNPENSFISLGFSVFIALAICIPEFIETFKECKGFFDLIIGVIAAIIVFIIFGADIILPIYLVNFFKDKKEEKGKTVESKDMIKYTLISFGILILVSFLVHFLWLLLAVVIIKILAMGIGGALFIGAFYLLCKYGEGWVVYYI